MHLNRRQTGAGPTSDNLNRMVTGVMATGNDLSAEGLAGKNRNHNFS